MTKLATPRRAAGTVVCGTKIAWAFTEVALLRFLVLLTLHLYCADAGTVLETISLLAHPTPSNVYLPAHVKWESTFNILPLYGREPDLMQLPAPSEDLNHVSVLTFDVLAPPKRQGQHPNRVALKHNSEDLYLLHKNFVLTFGTLAEYEERSWIAPWDYAWELVDQEDGTVKLWTPYGGGAWVYWDSGEDQLKISTSATTLRFKIERRCGCAQFPPALDSWMLKNGAALVQNAADLQDCKHCQSGEAMVFDGDDDYVQLHHGLRFGRDLTYSAWIKAEDVDAGTALINCDAMGCAVSQSSTDYDGHPYRAIDGGGKTGSWAEGSCTHTQGNSIPWWEVDFGSIRTLEHAILWNRMDCCSSRLERFEILIRKNEQTPWTVCYSHDGPPPGLGFTAPCRGDARFVRVKSNQPHVPLTICEIEFYESRAHPTIFDFGWAGKRHVMGFRGAFLRFATYEDETADQDTELHLLSGDKSSDGTQETGVPVPVQQWVHVAATVAGAQAVLYMNGVEMARGGVHAFNTVGGGNNNVVGRSFHGAIADLIVLRRALSHREVLAAVRGDMAQDSAFISLGGLSCVPACLPANTQVDCRACTARQSSSLALPSIGGAELALDGGGLNGDFHSGSCTSTRGATEQSPWWEADLGRFQDLTHLKVFGRMDQGEEGRRQLGGFEVWIGETADFSSSSAYRCYKNHDELVGPVTLAPCAGWARYVRIYLQDVTDVGHVLSLCEVQFFAQLTAPRKLELAGFPMTQISSSHDGFPEKAADGAGYDGNFWGNACTHTVGGEGTQWWMVDLLKPRLLSHLYVWSRIDFRERLVGFEVWGRIDGSTFSQCFKHPSGVPDLLTEARCTMEARWVMIRSDGTLPLTLCEVEIYEAPETRAVSLSEAAVRQSGDGLWWSVAALATDGEGLGGDFASESCSHAPADACEMGVHTCAADAECKDTVGGYECKCHAGFELPWECPMFKWVVKASLTERSRISFKFNGDIAFNFGARPDEGKIVLNSQTNFAWGPEVKLDFSFAEDGLNAFEFTMTEDGWEVYHPTSPTFSAGPYLFPHRLPWQGRDGYEVVTLATVSFDDTQCAVSAFEGDGFRCEACAAGFVRRVGHVPGEGSVNGVGGGTPVADCGVCAALCAVDEACASYECAPDQRTCSLNVEALPTAATLARGQLFCQKAAACLDGSHGCSPHAQCSGNEVAGGAGVEVVCSCRAGFSGNGTHCEVDPAIASEFLLSEEAEDPLSHEAWCVQSGGRLATVHSPDKMQRLGAFLAAASGTPAPDMVHFGLWRCAVAPNHLRRLCLNKESLDELIWSDGTSYSSSEADAVGGSDPASWGTAECDGKNFILLDPATHEWSCGGNSELTWGVCEIPKASLRTLFYTHAVADMELHERICKEEGGRLATIHDSEDTERVLAFLESNPPPGNPQGWAAYIGLFRCSQAAPHLQAKCEDGTDRDEFIWSDGQRYYIEDEDQPVPTSYSYLQSGPESWDAANCAERDWTVLHLNGTWACASGEQRGICERADVDECAAGAHTCSVQETCVNTAGSFECSPLPSAWWEVDLGSPSALSHLRIWNAVVDSLSGVEAVTAGSLAGFRVAVSLAPDFDAPPHESTATICYQNTDTPEDPPALYTEAPCPALARYVRIYGLSDLMLCEVEVVEHAPLGQQPPSGAIPAFEPQGCGCPSFGAAGSWQLRGGIERVGVHDCPLCRSQEALRIDGVSGYAEIGYLNFGGDMSYAAWVKAEAPEWWSRVFDFGNGPDTNNHLLGFYSDHGKLVFVSVEGSTQKRIISPGPLPLNVWVHVAAVVEGSVGRLYINGIEVASGEAVSPMEGRSRNYVGKSNWGGGQHWKGNIADLRIYDRALSAHAVMGVVLGETASDEYTHPSDCLPCLSECGTPGYRFPSSTLQKGALMLEDGPDFRGQVELNGVEAHVDLGTVSFTGDVTYVAWILCGPDAPQKWQARVFDFGSGEEGTNNNHVVYLQAYDMKPAFRTRGTDPLVAPDPIAVGEWVHLAATVRGTTGFLYVDGQLVASGPAIPAGPGVRTPAYLGRSWWPQDDYFHGTISNFRVYGRALSQREVLLNKIGDRALDDAVLPLFDAAPCDDLNTVQNVPCSTTMPAFEMLCDVAQSSTMGMQSADKAFDLATEEHLDKCAATDPSDENSPWWTVDLGREVALAGLRLELSSDEAKRLNMRGLEVWVSTRADWVGEQLCYKHGDSAPQVNLHTPCLARARYVKLRTRQPEGMTLCEVRVEEDRWAQHPKACGCAGFANTPSVFQGTGASVLAEQALAGCDLCPPPQVAAGVHLDGSGAHLNLGALTFGGSSMTFAAWIKAEAAGWWSRVFDFGSGPDTNNYLLGFHRDTGRLAFVTFRGPGDSKLVISPEALPLHTWVHVAVVVSEGPPADPTAGQASMYWNGRGVQSGEIYTPPRSERSTCYVGKSHWDSDAAFHGAITDLRVFGEALRDEEVVRVMLGQLTGGPGDVVGRCSGSCVSTGGVCSNRLFCDGEEWWDSEEQQCRAGTPVECEDGDLCNGISVCDDLMGCVAGAPLECPDVDGDPCNGGRACDPLLGCVDTPPPQCDDGLVCNGQERCEPYVGCVSGTPPVCDDGDPCNLVETCSEPAGCSEPSSSSWCDVDFPPYRTASFSLLGPGGRSVKLDAADMSLRLDVGDEALFQIVAPARGAEDRSYAGTAYVAVKHPSLALYLAAGAPRFMASETCPGGSVVQHSLPHPGTEKLTMALRGAAGAKVVYSPTATDITVEYVYQDVTVLSTQTEDELVLDARGKAGAPCTAAHFCGPGLTCFEGACAVDLFLECDHSCDADCASAPPKLPVPADDADAAAFTVSYPAQMLPAALYDNETLTPGPRGGDYAWRFEATAPGQTQRFRLVNDHFGRPWWLGYSEDDDALAVFPNRSQAAVFEISFDAAMGGGGNLAVENDAGEEQLAEQGAEESGGGFATIEIVSAVAVVAVAALLLAAVGRHLWARGGLHLKEAKVKKVHSISGRSTAELVFEMQSRERDLKTSSSAELEEAASEMEMRRLESGGSDRMPEVPLGSFKSKRRPQPPLPLAGSFKKQAASVITAASGTPKGGQSGSFITRFTGGRKLSRSSADGSEEDEDMYMLAQDRSGVFVVPDDADAGARPESQQAGPVRVI